MPKTTIFVAPDTQKLLKPAEFQEKGRQNDLCGQDPIVFVHDPVLDFGYNRFFPVMPSTPVDRFHNNRVARIDRMRLWWNLRSGDLRGEASPLTAGFMNAVREEMPRLFARLPDDYRLLASSMGRVLRATRSRKPLGLITSADSATPRGLFHEIAPHLSAKELAQMTRLWIESYPDEKRIVDVLTANVKLLRTVSNECFFVVDDLCEARDVFSAWLRMRSWLNFDYMCSSDITTVSYYSVVVQD